MICKVKYVISVLLMGQKYTLKESLVEGSTYCCVWKTVEQSEHRFFIMWWGSLWTITRLKHYLLSRMNQYCTKMLQDYCSELTNASFTWIIPITVADHTSVRFCKAVWQIKQHELLDVLFKAYADLNMNFSL